MTSDPHGVRPNLLAVVVLVAGVLGYVVLRLVAATGTGLPAVGWMSSVVLLFIAGGVLAAGLPIKRLQEGRPGPRPVGMLRAARTVVLAQACALTGAAVMGWYAAQGVILLGDVDIPSVRDRLWPVAATVLAGLLVAVAGLVVQRWCRIDDSDRPGHGPAGGTSPATPAGEAA